MNTVYFLNSKQIVLKINHDPSISNLKRGIIKQKTIVPKTAFIEPLTL
jgi:hypothetical protein